MVASSSAAADEEVGVHVYGLVGELVHLLLARPFNGLAGREILFLVIFRGTEDSLLRGFHPRS
jgi:hypothetical protein